MGAAVSHMLRAEDREAPGTRTLPKVDLAESSTHLIDAVEGLFQHGIKDGVVTDLYISRNRVGNGCAAALASVLRMPLPPPLKRIGLGDGSADEAGLSSLLAALAAQPARASSRREINLSNNSGLCATTQAEARVASAVAGARLGPLIVLSVACARARRGRPARRGGRWGRAGEADGTRMMR